MFNTKANNKFAIALICGIFLLVSTIIINAYRADAQCFDFNDFVEEGPVEIESSQVCVDFVNEDFSLYILGHLLDDGNKLGYVNLTGGFYRQADGRFFVYGSACAGTFGDVQGWAEASGELAGRGEVVDAGWNSASVWDGFVVDNFPGAIGGNGSAELTVDDVTIRILINGAI